jgi:hypothetical protein
MSVQGGAWHMQQHVQQGLFVQPPFDIAVAATTASAAWDLALFAVHVFQEGLACVAAQLLPHDC